MGHLAVCGTILQTPAPGQLQILPDALVLVDADGVIETVLAPTDSDYAAEKQAAKQSGALVELPAGQCLLPGMIDLHIHAPQWLQLGTGLDVPLEDWLQRYTFPLEAKYADIAFARRSYTSLVSTLLANGTTTGVYFASIHPAATRVLADICLALGQRALVGKVAMDHPDLCPAWYRDASAAEAATETRAFVDYVHSNAGNDSGRVLPVITPRCIPACTDDLLERLGALATETGCHVQTHCSESDWEHDHVLQRHGMTDALSLRRFGLLTRRTVLAHGTFVTDADLDAVGAAGAGFAHCPLSNAYLSDAVFPARRVLDHGVHAGLGTDIAGGHDASILATCRHAVMVSRLLESGVDASLPRGQRGRPGARIEPAEAFWLATAGGGQVLDLPIGLLAPGYRFDALAVEVPGNEFDSGDVGDRFQRIVFNAGREHIRKVWVDGAAVHPA